MSQNQLYFDKFDCSSFKQREKHVAPNKTPILFNNPCLLSKNLSIR
jgi:hypothetical protein